MTQSDKINHNNKYNHAFTIPKFVTRQLEAVPTVLIFIAKALHFSVYFDSILGKFGQAMDCIPIEGPKEVVILLKHTTKEFNQIWPSDHVIV